MRIKNVSGSTQTWAGQELTNNQEFDIPVQDVTTWQSTDKVFVDLVNGDLQIGDSNSYKETVSEAMAFLMEQ